MKKTQNGSISIALIGSGGSGIATAGDILLEAARRAGYFGRLTRSFGPQIRGGETAAFVQLSTTPDSPPVESYDLVFALDWNKAERFAAELTTGPQTCVVADEAAGEGPFTSASSTALPLKANAKAAGIRENLQMLAVLGGWLGLPTASLLEIVEARFRMMLGEDSRRLLESLAHTEAPPGLPRLAPPEPDGPRWVINGNEALGLGLLQSGLRFAAAYPITPATELLEWLAPRLDGLGGRLVQAEDELASVNMAIGASFGGVPAMTATSGPGLSLMQEGIGLSIAAEIPLLVVNVQRGGPSTGLPTKSEQADLLCSIFGAHGDAPHVVLAPLGVADCLPTAGWALALAETLQTTVILQSEQALAQTKIVSRPIEGAAAAPQRLRPAGNAETYRRYLDTDTGVSPMAIPGDEDRRYVADGLEHFEDARPTTAAAAHATQVAKRRRKLEKHDFGDLAIGNAGPEQAPTVIVAMGSLYRTACAAATQLTRAGSPTRCIGLRQLSPPCPDLLARNLEDATDILIVEQNDGAQLHRYLKGWWDLPATARSLARCGPIAISAAEIVASFSREQRRSA